MPVKIFICYAHEDEPLLKKLKAQLRPLQRQGLIEVWHDRDINAGTEWEREISEHLNAAQIILLLVSPDFMDSDYCYSIEMQRAIERHERKEACVIPIILRPVYWQVDPLGKLQVLPSDGKAITDSNWQNLDTAFYNVFEGVRKAAEELMISSSITLLSHETKKVSAEKAPFRLWHVPIRRNPFFTGRENILTILHNQLRLENTAALTQPQAISGLGGIGKTQIAVEYAYRFRHDYTFVFWINADTIESLISDFLMIASLLNLPEKNVENNEVLITTVKRWLELNKDWLLILDNADDLSIVYEFLPIGGTGHILLTTRAKAVGTIANSIEVEKMSREESTFLLLRRAKLLSSNTSFDPVFKPDLTEAAAIVKELDGLPLAIDQAGAFIEETNCGLSAYLDLFRTHRNELLQHRGSFAIGHPQPITTTWSLSFQRLEQVNPAAAELLRLCAFLDPDGIYEEIIIEGAPALGTILWPVAADPFKLNKAIEELLKFSLIRRNHDEKVLIIHRLVQTVIKDSMPPDIRRQWEMQTVYAFDRAFLSVYQKRGELVAFSILIQIYYNPILEYFTRQLSISDLQTVGNLMRELFIQFYKRLQNLSVEYFRSLEISSYIFEIAKELAVNDRHPKENHFPQSMIITDVAVLNPRLLGFSDYRDNISYNLSSYSSELILDIAFPEDPN